VQCYLGTEHGASNILAGMSISGLFSFNDLVKYIATSERGNSLMNDNNYNQLKSIILFLNFYVLKESHKVSNCESTVYPYNFVNVNVYKVEYSLFSLLSSLFSLLSLLSCLFSPF